MIIRINLHHIFKHQITLIPTQKLSVIAQIPSIPHDIERPAQFGLDLVVQFGMDGVAPRLVLVAVEQLFEQHGRAVVTDLETGL